MVLPEASADGKLLHGQNWDWRAECAETGVVLRINREDGPTVLTFTEAGGLARCGMNSAGVALTANFLGSDRDGRAPGVPLVLLRRRALESAHFALGIQTIYATGKWVSNNIMLSHAGGAAVDIESAPDESFLIQPDQGLLVHANHFESPAALAKLRDTGLPSTPDSAYRAQRVRGHLAPKRGAIGIDDLKAAFFDDFASPYAVCRPPRPAAIGRQSVGNRDDDRDEAGRGLDGDLPAARAEPDFHPVHPDPIHRNRIGGRSKPNPAGGRNERTPTGAWRW